MQCAIDNAKRKFDVDLSREIRRIKKDMNIQEHGYPNFWTVIRRDFDKKKVNKTLQCPMNYLYDITVDNKEIKESTLPMSYFYKKFELKDDRRKSKRVEELIQKYSYRLYSYNIDDEDENRDDYLLLRSDFDQMVNDIRQIYISERNYLGLISWLINRAFSVGSGVRGNQRQSNVNSTLKKNRALLLKVLYEVNKSAFLQCFSNNLVHTN